MLPVMTFVDLRRTSRAACGAVLLTFLPQVVGPWGASAPRRWDWPLDPIPHVVRYFEPPSSPYGAGHRGVDLAGDVAQQVLAIGDGTVAFAGSVAGSGVVVVEHGTLRSTYQPVTAVVSVGDEVRIGQPIGFLQLLHSHCAPAACLHLGVRRGDAYLDPLTLLGARPVRLKPLDGLGDGRRLVTIPEPTARPEGATVRQQPRAHVAALGARIGLAAGQARG